MKTTVRICTLALMLGVFAMTPLYAQEVAGDWQGTLTAGPAKLRLVLRIVKAGSGWTGALFSIDQTPDWGAGAALESVSLQSGNVNIQVPEIGGAYEGKLSADGTSMAGAWIQGGRLPLEFRRATKETEWKDPSPHTVKFVTVNGNVKLEVLDWGGTGRPVLLLAGLGNTAHIFDTFALKLRASYHVYGLTRRGFGASSAPGSGYSTDRLADDVLEVIDFLKLNKPVVAGHSIAGQELSSIGSRHAEKVAGLIYLDADPALENADRSDGHDPKELAALPRTMRAILEGGQKYTRIQGPVLGLYAFEGQDAPAETDALVKAFEKGIPSSRVVRMPFADHFLFLSNETAVLREVNAFIATLQDVNGIAARAAEPRNPVTPPPAQSGGVEGDWQGALTFGPNSLRLVFHITKSSDGMYLGQIESLDQGTVIPIDSVQLTGDSVRVEAKLVQGTFQGTFSADKTAIKGTWTQGTSVPLELTRMSQAAAAAAKAAPPPDLLANMVKAMGIPMDIQIPVAPTAFAGHGGATNLVYELHMTNLSPIELHLNRIEVLNGSASLVAYEGVGLNGILQQFGAADVADKRVLGPGLRAVAFVWVRVNQAAPVPMTLRNRITVDGYPVENNLTVSAVKPVVLGPPLRGADWMAANGPSNTSGHRRALMPVEGKLHNAQRFAIDWVKQGADGRTFTGDQKDNKSYHAYGSDALAVADATVVAIKDGIPENVPGVNSRAVPITLETIGGNHVILDLGSGRFAFYAHLQPGSLKVKLGDKVRRGQLLGLVGNSGNSTEPHLHFHVSDANSPLASEGLPYVLESFEVTSAVAPGPKTNALPLEGTRVKFPEPR